MKRKSQLKNMADVRRFLSRIINELDRSEIEESKGRTLAYMASVLKGVIETGDLEQRVLNLEKQIAEKGKELCQSKPESRNLKAV